MNSEIIDIKPIEFSDVLRNSDINVVFKYSDGTVEVGGVRYRVRYDGMTREELQKLAAHERANPSRAITVIEMPSTGRMTKCVQEHGER